VFHLTLARGAHEARLPGDEFPVILVAQAHRFPQRSNCANARRFAAGGGCRFLAGTRIKPACRHNARCGIGGLAITKRRESCLKPLLHNLGISSIGGTTRGAPDAAAAANPNTGVWVYDTNAGGWIIVGGTSVTSPVVAGITNNAGHFSLSSSAEMARIYANPSMSFDIERGICGHYAGYWAATGWDFCSGVGSPAGTGGL
jgi:hypothetical protein